jgi:hypothetical protein
MGIVQCLFVAIHELSYVCQLRNSGQSSVMDGRRPKMSRMSRLAYCLRIMRTAFTLALVERGHAGPSDFYK